MSGKPPQRSAAHIGVRPKHLSSQYFSLKGASGIPLFVSVRFYLERIRFSFYGGNGRSRQSQNNRSIEIQDMLEACANALSSKMQFPLEAEFTS